MILMDGIQLYHASYKIITNIDLNLCSSGKDFGKGFYLTTDYKQARRFIKTSITKALKNHLKDVQLNKGYISVFEYKNNSCTHTNYYEFNGCDAEWLHCIAAHRKTTFFESDLEKYKNYDIMAGKIANDSTNQVLTAYINGFYGQPGSSEADKAAIHFLLPDKLSNQICFRSKKSLSLLSYKKSILIDLEQEDENE